MRWPAGFMRGTGASSTQCEGAAPASDWWDWERAGRAPLSGAGNGFASRYPEDFRLLAELGLRHHRLSIEWARIEPEPGVHDPKAIAHYRDVLRAARDAGIVPWVCLHHFTLPRWFAASGGFLVERNRTEAWRRYVDFVAETFGDLVGGWQPVNEMKISENGVVLVYNGANHPKRGDTALPPFGYQPGQMLFDASDPLSCIARAGSPFLRPSDVDAASGQVGNVCFAQGLVLFEDRWLLYYGMADSRIGCAVAAYLRSR